MAHNDPMTWRANERRWTKWYQGKTYNVSPRKLIKEGFLEKGSPATKEATRSAMRRWWEQTQAAIDALAEDAATAPENITLSGAGIDVSYDENGTETRQQRTRLLIKRPVPTTEGTPPGFVDNVADRVNELIAEGQRRVASVHNKTNPKQTVQTDVSDFLGFKRSQAEAGERTIDRVDGLRVHLEHFTRWFGPGQSATTINEQTVEGYYRHVLGECGKGIFSRYYARDLFASFRQFTRWLAGQRRIGMPHNLDSRDYGFKLRSEIKIFTDEQVKALLTASTDRTKLYLLLMLNTGGTQIDIAELPKTALDLEAGTLTRKRFKTEDHENVPTVVYPLWPETLRLLRTHLSGDDSVRNRHGEPLALISADGKPLLVKRQGKDGKLTKTDAIRSAFNRVIRKLKNDGTDMDGSLKHLRKTASSKLEAHPEYGRYVVHFLGQAPTTVAERHYVKPSEEQFSQAITWLGKHWL